MTDKNLITVLLDVDNTIFDNELARAKISDLIDVNYGKNANLDLWKLWDEVGKEVGHIDTQEIAMRFAKARNSSDFASVIACFLEIPFEQLLRPKAKSLLNYLSEKTNLVIFTDGDMLYQKTKIEKLGLAKVAKKVILSTSKVKLIAGIIDKQVGKVVIIDDKPKIIQEAIRVGGCATVWANYGRHTKGWQTVGADFESEDLGQIEEYLKRLVDSNYKNIA